jgi:hypothetical protein
MLTISLYFQYFTAASSKPILSVAKNRQKKKFTGSCQSIYYYAQVELEIKKNESKLRTNTNKNIGKSRKGSHIAHTCDGFKAMDLSSVEWFRQVINCLHRCSKKREEEIKNDLQRGWRDAEKG